MAKTVDFTDKTFDEWNKKVENSSPEDMVVPEVKDTTKAVDPTTGKVDEQSVPADNPTVNTQPTNGNAQQNNGATPTQNNGNAPFPQPGLAQAPQQPQAPVTPKGPLLTEKSFEGKKGSFFGVDAEKGFWATLDSKIDEALKGGTADEVAQNMMFATMTFLFDMISNWADHHRKEAKKAKKEGEDKIAAYEHDIGVTRMHKDLAVWAVIADHPALRQYQGKPITKETRKAVEKVLRHDKAAQKTICSLVESMTGIKQSPDEQNKTINNALNMYFGNATLDGVGLYAQNEPKIQAALQTAGVNIQGLHQQVAAHQANVAQNQANQAILNNAQNQGQNAPQPQQQQQQQQQQPTR